MALIYKHYTLIVSGIFSNEQQTKSNQSVQEERGANVGEVKQTCKYKISTAQSTSSKVSHKTSSHSHSDSSICLLVHKFSLLFQQDQDLVSSN